MFESLQNSFSRKDSCVSMNIKVISNTSSKKVQIINDTSVYFLLIR
jgi:hypothetical protein